MLETVDYALIDASFLPMVNLAIVICRRSRIHSFQKPWRCLRKAAEVRNKICLYKEPVESPSGPGSDASRLYRIEASMRPGKASDCRWNAFT